MTTVRPARGWWLDLGDRAVASDPGLNRLRMATSAVVSLGSALAVEVALAAAIGADAATRLVMVLLGAVVAMMGSMGLSGPDVWPKVRTAVFFPVAIGVGAVLATSVAGHPDTGLVVFVAVMFLAVAVRRFGLPFLFYGFMTWMGYFFATFVQATWSVLPALFLAVVVASGWVLLLSSTLLRTHRRRTLLRTLRAFDARARGVAHACAQLLDAARADAAATRPRRRVHRRQNRLAEAALMIEGWLADPGALPPGWSGAAVRRRLLDRQLAVDGLVGATELLAGGDPAATSAAAQVLRSLSRHPDVPAAGDAAARTRVLLHRAGALAQQDGPVDDWRRVCSLARAAGDYLELAAEADRPPDVDALDTFEPAVELAMGNLPGSAAIARDVRPRGHRWNPLVRLDLNTRQAVQAAVAGALAIIVGRELSPTRYYWAVIAAFVVFTGTSTRSESFLKATARVAGTLVGLVAAIWLARLTAGNGAAVLAVILGCMFCGFYLIRVSYAYMIFFITIMLGQLYSALHLFSDELLVLRLEETAAGAAVAIVVALLVAPLSTRDTVRLAESRLLDSLAGLLEAAAERAEGVRPGRDLDALTLSLDDRLRQLLLVAAPLTRTLLWANDPRRARHRLTLFRGCANHSRRLVAALRDGTGGADGTELAGACRTLAGTAAALSAGPAAATGLRLPESLVAAPSGGRAGRALDHLHQLLGELALRGTPEDAGPAADAPAPSS